MTSILFLFIGAVLLATAPAHGGPADAEIPRVSYCEQGRANRQIFFCFSERRTGTTGPTDFSARFLFIGEGDLATVTKGVGWINAGHGVEWIADDKVLYQTCQFGPGVVSDGGGGTVEDLDRGCDEWRILDVRTLEEKALKLPGAAFSMARPVFRYPLVAYAVELPSYRFGCKVFDLESNREVVFLKTTAHVPETDVPETALATFSGDGRYLICMSGRVYFAKELPGMYAEPAR